MRLMDADALLEIYEDRKYLLMERFGYDSSEAGVLSGAIKLLEAQPTISLEHGECKDGG